MRAQEEHERLRRAGVGSRAHEPPERDGRTGRLAGSRNHATDCHGAQQRPCGHEFSGQAARRIWAKSGKRFDSIVGDADRAGDIVDRIRDQIKKAPPRKARFDLNEAINEVIVLARSAITTNGVSVQTRLAEGLVPVQGDRVQLQQVVLNLILNAVEAMSTVEAGPRELLISTEQTQTGGFSCPCAIPGRALIRTISIAFSRLSTPRSPAEWGWDCRSAGRSSMPMGAGCGQT